MFCATKETISDGSKWNTWRYSLRSIEWFDWCNLPENSVGVKYTSGWTCSGHIGTFHCWDIILSGVPESLSSYAHYGMWTPAFILLVIIRGQDGKWSITILGITLYTQQLLHRNGCESCITFSFSRQPSIWVVSPQQITVLHLLQAIHSAYIVQYEHMASQNLFIVFTYRSCPSFGAGIVMLWNFHTC